jgi:hypothetical protein
VEFSFGEHVLDLDRRELRRGAELIALEPQVFDLLVYPYKTAITSSASTIYWRRYGAVESLPSRPLPAASAHYAGQSATAATLSG